MDVRFKTPANFYVCEQTQAGKRHFTRRMLRHLEELFYPVPTKIIYSRISENQGFPDNLNDMVRGHDSSLLVLDDLMSQCSNDQRVADLFTRGSHHREISVLYLTENLFPPGKLSRTISLNSHYFVIFRNPRDSLGISTLAKQMFPGCTDYLMESFRDATSRPYGYLVIDCHQLTPENVRLRTNILPGQRQIAYVKRT